MHEYEIVFIARRGAVGKVLRFITPHAKKVARKHGLQERRFPPAPPCSFKRFYKNK